MKHQFKYNPLATAILTLLCGSSISSYAASLEAASTATNEQLRTAIKESYPGQHFFEQYYVDKSAPEAKQRQTQSPNAEFCSGIWITPIGSDAKPQESNTATSVITADYGHYNPNGDSILEGNVVIEQQGRQVKANKVTIDKTQTYANAEGQVQMAQNGLLAQSDHINYNLKTQFGDLENSLYISEDQNAHGRADKIIRSSANVVVLNNATYSTCPPSQAPTWQLKSKEIVLDQDSGRGETRNTKLYIKNVPVLAVPYFNFPIDDRRKTGLLTPNFGYSNTNGFEIGAPIYLNLAPNYDATVTPRFLYSRGAMLQGEFRFLTENFGGGRIGGGFLPSDKQYDDKDRKQLDFDYFWQINPAFSTYAEYNYASDKDYFSDLNNNPNSRTDLNLRRVWGLNYSSQQIPGLRANLKVEDFQTLDPSVPDQDRPYARLPQLLVNYSTGNPEGFQFEFNNDSAYFKKDINDFTSNAEPSGTRIYNDFALRYNYSNPWAYIRPSVAVRNINTFYDLETKSRIDANTTDTSRNSQNISLVVPEFTLDTALNFEKEGKYLQVLTPRLFYAYAPYRNQNGNPVFDSVAATINYDQLFNPRRFYGHDRLEDNNFASLGLSYSLFDPVGLERLRASIGQSFFFEDRRVTLNEDYDKFDTEKRTGPVMSLSSQINKNVTLNANSAWLSSGENASRSLSGLYTANNGALYSIGYYYEKDIPNRQRKYDQVTASFVQPIKDQWRIIGHAQYDIENRIGRDYLLGINYQSCCWGISVYGRSYYNDLDNVNEPGVKANKAIMAEVTFKGLGSFNNKLASLLESRILGLNTVNQSWTKR
ncbi:MULTISPECIES: LPS-assembly protein LptD [unclassified Acinetobacter]|uniref:LPS-assembly protein LptD n=1 Tax=unclassified Acinetobacter TaxID=196816 RepID=UPI0029345855|nr:MULTISPECIES: LPS-assembly protein LptD [unclassified Acinetobacter]WOE32049.1 LPS-assembly protein LptD [Acinetobacter sp. SAAs470]WOE37518.1 LPS-assembly protein LptD [Acinetobacter sp. SAAs474]